MIIGTVFLRVPQDTAAFFSRGGVLFLYVPDLIEPQCAVLTLAAAQRYSVRSSDCDGRNSRTLLATPNRSPPLQSRNVPSLRRRTCLHPRGHANRVCDRHGIRRYHLLPRGVASVCRPVFVSSPVPSHPSSELIRVHFSIFLLFSYTMTVAMRSWFRVLAAAFKSAAPAQTVAGLAILLLVLYTGYTLPQPSMIGALRWITYINVSALPCFLPARICL